MAVVKVSVDVSATIRQMQNLRKQIRYATAVALTRTAQDARAEIPAALDRALDRPTPFTKRGTFVQRATPSTLTAMVGFRPKQAEYMRYQIEGGVRRPHRRALKLPASIGLNAYGNIPRSAISKLVSVAQRESKLTRRRSRTIKVSNKLDLFYGDPKDLGANEFPPGIYKRVRLPSGAGQLVPIIVFPEQSARYKKRFDFLGMVQKVARQRFGPRFIEALRSALATAR